MRTLAALLFVPLVLFADGSGRVESKYVATDFRLSADPTADQWEKVKPIVAENDAMGKPTPNHRTEIRTLWSDKYLYLFYTCPFEQLYLKPNPTSTEETNSLWDWDVAEVFVGADFKNIRQYREFQVSPQSEWVDLYIDRDKPRAEGGWKWNADGFAVKARVDEAKKIWYGEMRIPFNSFDTRKPQAGNEVRINFFRIQGPGPDRRFIAWQPTNDHSYHVPEAFGRLILTK